MCRGLQADTGATGACRQLSPGPAGTCQPQVPCRLRRLSTSACMLATSFLPALPLRAGRRRPAARFSDADAEVGDGTTKGRMAEAAPSCAGESVARGDAESARSVRISYTRGCAVGRGDALGTGDACEGARLARDWPRLCGWLRGERGGEAGRSEVNDDAADALRLWTGT